MNLIRLESLGMMFLPLLVMRGDPIICVVMPAEVCEENPIKGKSGVEEFKGVNDC